MSLNRWKVLACTLTVGVGGLAVFATDPAPTKADPAKEPAPLPSLSVKPASPSNGADTPAPVIPVKGEDFEQTIPVPPAIPAKAAEPVFEPVSPLIVPVKGDGDSTEPKKAEPAKKDAVPPTIIIPPVPKLTEAKDPPKTPVIEVEIPTLPKVSAGADPFQAPPPKTAPDALKTPPPPPAILHQEVPKVPELAKPAPPAAPKAAEAAKLKMLLRMGDGQPRFEIRNSATTEMLLKVYGEKIEMQAPPESRSSIAGVTAIGRVRFTAPGLEGTCDHLTILSGTGEVLLKGTVVVKTRYGKASREMSAEKMVFQIGTGGLASPSGPRSPITPASYIPD